MSIQFKINSKYKDQKFYFFFGDQKVFFPNTLCTQRTPLARKYGYGASKQSLSHFCRVVQKASPYRSAVRHASTWDPKFSIVVQGWRCEKQGQLNILYFFHFKSTLVILGFFC